MANQYKVIGNTAVAVMSLLAIGTLCWWQRTAGPIDAPRPQDEAEIMTACLERHYAMGRTGTTFTSTQPEYVSTVADRNATGGVRYVTNSAAFTLTNTIGFFPNATFNYPQSIRDALAPCAGSYGRADACRWLLPSNTYWQTGVRDWTWTGGMWTNYLHTETNWWTNLVTLSTRTLITAAYTNVQTTQTVVITGWKVSSSLQDGIYSYVKYSDYSIYMGWPTDTIFANTGNNPPDGFSIQNEYYGPGETMLIYINYDSTWEASADDNIWMAWGPFGDTSLPSVLTPGEFFEGDLTISYGVWTTFAYRVEQVLLTNQTPCNAWTNKAFAFERDSKPYWWSTNAYNDMARALSMMQWQVNEASIVCCTNVMLTMYRTDDSQTNGPYAHSISTNFEGTIPYYGGYHPSTIYFYMQMGGTYTQDWPRSGGRFVGAMEGGMKCWKYAITNNSCFAWTNVQILARVSTNNSYIAANATWTPDIYNAIVTVTNYLSPGAGAVSPWYPFDPISAATFLTTNMVAWSDKALPFQPAIIDFAIPASYLAVNENHYFDELERCSEIAQGYLPYVNVSPATNVIAYRVKFATLTNYLDHAPAR